MKTTKDDAILNARMRKVSKLVDVFRSIGATVAQVERMSDEQWALAEKAAEIRPASAETRSMVIDRMRLLAKPTIRKAEAGWIATARGRSTVLPSWEAARLYVRNVLNPFPRY